MDTPVLCEAFFCYNVATCDIEHNETGDIFSACDIHKATGTEV